MAGTTVVYNGITIADCLTEGIEQEVFFDPAGVDPVAVRSLITVTGTVHTVQGAGHGVSPLSSSANFITHLDDACEKLMVPRKAFSMTVGNDTLFDVIESHNVPDGARLNSFDVNNGPKPRLRINKILGSTAAKVTFSVEICVGYCSRQVYRSSMTGLVSFRYWVGDEIDGTTWLTTRTYQGKLRVAHAGVNPSALFLLSLPRIQPGFRRARISHTQSQNGLDLDFRITDEEQYAQAPTPACSWDGHFTISTPTVSEAIGDAEISISLTGDVKTDKRKLANLATKIIENKLHFADMEANGGAYVYFFSITESLPHNRVDAAARFKIIGGSASGSTVMNFANQSGFCEPLTIPDYNKAVVYAPGQSATLTGLFKQALQDPCALTVFPLTKDDPPEPYKPEVEKGDEGGDSGGTGLDPGTERPYTPSHLSNPYTNYLMSSDYHHESGEACLPLGRRLGTAIGNAAANATTVKVSFHQPRTTRVITIEAERLNKWPELPEATSFSDGDIVNTLANSTTTPCGATLSADGRKSLHRTDARLVYELSRPPRSDEGFRVGTLPYRTAGQQTNVLPGDLFIAPSSSNYIA